VLALAGGVIGPLVLPGAATRWCASNRRAPRLGGVTVNPEVMAFTALMSMLTGLLVGSLPAWQITRGTLVGALREGGRGAPTGRRGTRVLYAR
jgi:hypothetical protein